MEIISGEFLEVGDYVVCIRLVMGVRIDYCLELNVFDEDLDDSSILEKVNDLGEIMESLIKILDDIGSWILINFRD